MSLRSRATRIVMLGAMTLLVLGCGGGGSTAARNSASGAASSSSRTSGGGTSGVGTFHSGKATIVTPSETIDLALSSGSFVKALGAHGSVSVDWADGEQNDVGLVGDGNGGYKLSVVGRAAPNGITQNDCTATVTKDESSGVEGTYTCAGGITGSFEAH